MKVVINRCYGGFCLSSEACAAMAGKCSHVENEYGSGHRDAEARTCPVLLEVIEQLGSAADGKYASLMIVEIPDGVRWHIHDYDGMESVEEEHRSWP